MLFLLGNEIPIVTVSTTRALQHGDNFTIVCGVTNLHLSTSLRTLSWYKDGVLKCHVYFKNSNPGNVSDALGSLVVENAVVKDGGNYTCVVHLLLRRFKEHNVSNTSVVQSESCYLKSLQFIWKIRWFRTEFEWNCLSLWNVFGKKGNTFRGITFFSF